MCWDCWRSRLNSWWWFLRHHFSVLFLVNLQARDVKQTAALSETSLPWATMPQLLPTSYFGSSHPWQIFVCRVSFCLVCKTLETHPELLCLLGVRCGFAEPRFRVTSAHPLSTNVLPWSSSKSGIFAEIQMGILCLCLLWKHHSWAAQLPETSFLKHCQ